MLVTKKSPLSGQINTRDLNITQDQLDKFFQGEKVQHAFPHLSSDDREFILTGITPEEWDQTFKDL